MQTIVLSPEEFIAKARQVAKAIGKTADIKELIKNGSFCYMNTTYEADSTRE